MTLMEINSAYSKKIKSFAVLSIFCAMCFASSLSRAENGVVDLDKIRENYSVAQSLTAELKVKEGELQNFITDAQKQIQGAKTPVDKKNIEEKLGEQFNIKRAAIAKDQAEKWAKLEDDVIKAIKAVSDTKKLEMVFTKQMVITGGTDITEEVLAKLNTKK